MGIITIIGNRQFRNQKLGYKINCENFARKLLELGHFYHFEEKNLDILKLYKLDQHLTERKIPSTTGHGRCFHDKTGWVNYLFIYANDHIEWHGQWSRFAYLAKCFAEFLASNFSNAPTPPSCRQWRDLIGCLVDTPSLTPPMMTSRSWPYNILRGHFVSSLLGKFWKLMTKEISKSSTQ